MEKTIVDRLFMDGELVGEPRDRFFRSFHKTEGCWIWEANRTALGYGRFHLGRKTLGAHRVAWALYRGPIPEGLCVLHNCPDGDNPSCVNPAHLWLGTQLDNVRDRHAKGRDGRSGGFRHRCHRGAENISARSPEIRQGIRNGNVKISEIDVQVIRACHDKSRAVRRRLAETLGVDKETVRRIISGEYWKHLPYYSVALEDLPWMTP